MRAAILALLLLAGCAHTGVYPVEQHARWVGVALSSDTLLTIQHDNPVGLYVVNGRGFPVPVKVIRRENYGLGHSLLWLRARDGYELDLEPGDSGSPVALIVERVADGDPGRFR